MKNEIAENVRPKPEVIRILKSVLDKKGYFIETKTVVPMRIKEKIKRKIPQRVLICGMVLI